MKAEDILGLSDLKTKRVKVPQWNTEVTVQELDLEGGLRLFQMYADGEGELDGKQVAEIVSLGVINGNGERVFSDDQRPELMRKNRDAVLMLFREITSLSRVDAEKN